MTAALETLCCGDCGTTWPRPVTRGRNPQRCTPCTRTAKRARQQQRATTGAPDPTPVLVTNLVNYRLAIEIAIPAIKIGRYQDALEALEGARP